MSSPQHEPTMEEILASIRKIISEDTPEAVQPAVSQPPAPEPAAQELLTTAPQAAEPADAEVLELTQEIFEVPEPVRPEPSRMDEVVFETVPPAAEPAVFAASVSTTEDGIFSDHTRKAMDDAFASIEEEPARPAPPPSRPAAPIPHADGASVESVFERAVRESFEPVLQKYLADNSGLVVERMKPLIREWMDEHFPALLEGAVRSEIERVVRARGRR